MKSEKWNSKQTQKSRKSRDSGSESDGTSEKSEKHRHRRTQESYRCHQVGHIARYCPSTAPVESGALTETAATTMTTTSIENYWMTVTGRSPEKESWYFDCATTSHVCGDRQEFVQYTQYAKRDEREIHDFTGMVTGKAIGYGDVQLRLRLPGHRRYHEVVVRNVLHIEGAHNSLSQSRLMGRGLRIVPVNGYRIKIYDKSPVEDSAWGRGQGQGWGQGWGWGRGSLVGVACQIRALFRLDVRVTGKRYRARGWLLWRSFGGAPGTVDCFGGATGMGGHVGGASGKLYLCFLRGLVGRSWYCPGGVWGRVWVWSSRG